MAIKTLINDLLNKKPVDSKQVAMAEMDAEEHRQKEIFDKIEHQRKFREGFLRFVKDPVGVIVEKPTNVLYISLPIAVLAFLSGFISMVANYGFSVLFTTTMIDDTVILAVLIAIIPLAVLDLRDGMRINSLETALPNFFRDVAGMNESGMTLPHAIHVVSEGEYGALTPYIRRLDTEMSWSVPFVDAIRRFGQRLRSPLATRSVDLNANASTAGGNVSEVLRAAASDAYEFVNLHTERKNSMMIYMIIVLLSFFVFLFVIAVLSSTFLSTMAEAGKAVATSGAASQFMGSVDLFLYNRLFCHAALMQGFFSGLAAGVMGEGRVVAGLKYSAIMIIITWVAFRFFI